ncbi:MAG TPA: MOSC N-terminal beta barrel domain-containing protein [Candidatus Binataceae bacterium]|jgi:uncharacterized protein YcbX|nr:MOSC N-terminal beta barrel domain-containing protein [Candidatus Binataceae bacterium]
MQRQIGTVQAIWRYPVKSLRGEALAEAQIDERGIVGDRRWALRELARGGIMSARIWAAMLQLGARYESSDGGATVYLELPDGRSMRAGDPLTDQALSAIFGREIRLEAVRRERLSPADLEAIMRGEAFPPARDFFDEDVLHLIASGTLAHLRELRPAADFDPRRFRANIYIDTGAEHDGFIEDRWLEGELVVGERVRIVGMRPAIRCVMTTHPQPDLPRDVSILRTAAQHHDAYVGVFAAVGESGSIRLGDPVVLSC